MEHIIEDNQGLHTLDTENADDLRLSKRTFGQLYCIYILMHNETIRNKRVAKCMISKESYSKEYGSFL